MCSKQLGNTKPSLQAHERGIYDSDERRVHSTIPRAYKRATMLPGQDATAALKSKDYKPAETCNAATSLIYSTNHTSRALKRRTRILRSVYCNINTLRLVLRPIHHSAVTTDEPTLNSFLPRTVPAQSLSSSSS
jgi:hypothetical protein